MPGAAPIYIQFNFYGFNDFFFARMYALLNFNLNFLPMQTQKNISCNSLSCAPACRSFYEWVCIYIQLKRIQYSPIANNRKLSVGLHSVCFSIYTYMYIFLNENFSLSTTFLIRAPFSCLFVWKWYDITLLKKKIILWTLLCSLYV